MRQGSKPKTLPLCRRPEWRRSRTTPSSHSLNSAWYPGATHASLLSRFGSRVSSHLRERIDRSSFHCLRTRRIHFSQVDTNPRLDRGSLQLRTALDQLQAINQSWSILLEFPIPRKEKRIDVVILAGDTIILLELKSSMQGLGGTRQAEEYALLLHYFHQPSNKRQIVAFVVSPTSRSSPHRAQGFLPIEEAPAYWIPPVTQISWKELPVQLAALTKNSQPSIIDAEAWDHGEYRPVPTIIDAALGLQSGLSIREIAHSRAARYDVEKLTAFVDKCIHQARATRTFTICFVTGVPGSGKTLVGLNLAFGKKASEHPIHFMSGTGPLVKVLQAALAEDHRQKMNVSSEEARMKAKTLIENVHVFARYYAEDNPYRAPSNHIIIFDEAQRAWDRAQNLSKFKRPYSEPQMLLQIMERHQDWAVVIALVGGGQEINNGEAGLAEWGRALAEAQKPWTIYASPEALEGGSAVAGSQLFAEYPSPKLQIHAESQLHLDVSVRSIKADSYSAWVNFVVNGDQVSAAALKAQEHFPILLTRSLTDLRLILRQNSLGESRCGLVASSAAARIRAEGLEPDSTFHGEYPWHHWYLAESSDVRSSQQLEVFATEFEIQGLELDWIGLCWGGDFIWSPRQEQWLARKLAHKRITTWSNVKQEHRQTYRRNAYRVLLTRARQGIVLFVPHGDSSDITRLPAEFDATADFLLACGARIATPMNVAPEAPAGQASFFI